VLKVNVEAGNVHALLRTENVTRMFVGIVGSGEFVIVFIFCFTFYCYLGKKSKALTCNSFCTSTLSHCLLVKDLSHLSNFFKKIYLSLRSSLIGCGLHLLKRRSLVRIPPPLLLYGHVKKKITSTFKKKIQYMLLRLTAQIYVLSYACTHVNCRNQIAIAI
jgi:hypothetical protein